MSGFQEILIIVLILLGILFLPRRVSNRPEKSGADAKPKLTGKIRAAVAVAVVYLALAAAWLQPWRSDPVAFLYIGFGPVVLAGLAFWVYAGFKHR